MEHKPRVWKGSEYDKEYKLLMSVINGQYQKVKELLDLGVNINIGAKSGMSLLMLACQENRGSIVKLLLDRGVGFNLRGTEGRSAIFAAIVNKSYNCVKHLLNMRNIRVDIPDFNGCYPLTEALRLVVSDQENNVHAVQCFWDIYDISSEEALEVTISKASREEKEFLQGVGLL